MSVQRPSKTLPRERTYSNRKSNRPRMDPNLSFLQHSSVKASSPRVTFELHMGSTIRNVNPEKSMSTKGRRPYHSKVSARRSGKRPTKPLREVSEFVLFDNEISLSSAAKEQQRLNESLMRTSTLRDLAGDSDREKLIRDLQTNSLQLFRLGEKVLTGNNVEHRKADEAAAAVRGSTEEVLGPSPIGSEYCGQPRPRGGRRGSQKSGRSASVLGAADRKHWQPARGFEAVTTLC